MLDIDPDLVQPRLGRHPGLFARYGVLLVRRQRHTRLIAVTLRSLQPSGHLANPRGESIVLALRPLRHPLLSGTVGICEIKTQLEIRTRGFMVPQVHLQTGPLRVALLSPLLILLQSFISGSHQALEFLIPAQDLSCMSFAQESDFGVPGGKVTPTPLAHRVLGG